MKYELNSTVDVIPVINVALVIVLTLMMIAPLLAEELPVELPEAKTANQFRDDRVDVICTLDGRVAVDGVVVEPQGLAGALRAAMSAKPGLPTVVNADRNLTYGQVKGVLDELERVGATKISLATEHES
jgi:biopolymer transport protein ExbD